MKPNTTIRNIRSKCNNSNRIQNQFCRVAIKLRIKIKLQKNISLKYCQKRSFMVCKAYWLKVAALNILCSGKLFPWAPLLMWATLKIAGGLFSYNSKPSPKSELCLPYSQMLQLATRGPQSGNPGSGFCSVLPKNFLYQECPDGV